MLGFIRRIWLFTGAAVGIAQPYPDVTPLPNLDKRQQQPLPVQSIWSPKLSGTSVVYAAFSCEGASTLALTGSRWDCCDQNSASCPVPTLCNAGTLFYAGTSIACSAINNSNRAYSRCGTQVLLSSISASQSLDKLMCPGPTDSTRYFFYMTSPPASTSSTSSSQSTTANMTTSTTTETGSGNQSDSHLGAIIGGAVGGIAALALLVLAIFLLLRRRRKNGPSSVTVPGGQGYQAVSASDAAKHLSYHSAPGSPPPLYFDHSGQQQHAPYHHQYTQHFPHISPAPPLQVGSYAEVQQSNTHAAEVPTTTDGGVYELPGSSSGMAANSRSIELATEPDRR